MGVAAGCLPKASNQNPGMTRETRPVDLSEVWDECRPRPALKDDDATVTGSASQHHDELQHDGQPYNSYEEKLLHVDAHTKAQALSGRRLLGIILAVEHLLVA